MTVFGEVTPMDDEKCETNFGKKEIAAKEESKPLFYDCYQPSLLYGSNQVQEIPGLFSTNNLDDNKENFELN